MKPVLASWQKKYETKGLVILDIDDGGADTLEALKKDVAAGGAHAKGGEAPLRSGAVVDVATPGVPGFCGGASVARR